MRYSILLRSYLFIQGVLVYIRYSLILRSHLYIQGVLVYIEPDYTIISISSLISVDTGCPGINKTKLYNNLYFFAHISRYRMSCMVYIEPGYTIFSPSPLMSPLSYGYKIRLNRYEVS